MTYEMFCTLWDLSRYAAKRGLFYNLYPSGDSVDDESLELRAAHHAELALILTGNLDAQLA